MITAMPALVLYTLSSACAVDSGNTRGGTPTCGMTCSARRTPAYGAWLDPRLSAAPAPSPVWTVVTDRGAGASEAVRCREVWNAFHGGGGGAAFGGGAVRLGGRTRAASVVNPQCWA